MSKKLVNDAYRLRSFVYLWVSPTEATLYPVEGKPNGFSSYVQAWEWVYENGLQMNVSVYEHYQPIPNNPHQQRSGLLQVMQRNAGMAS